MVLVWPSIGLTGFDRVSGDVPSFNGLCWISRVVLVRPWRDQTRTPMVSSPFSFLFSWFERDRIGYLALMGFSRIELFFSATIPTFISWLCRGLT